MNYEIIRSLGSGAFGNVCLAREKISGRFVAIKRLRIEDRDYQDEIIHETKVLSSFSHPNIVTYHHAYEEDGLINLVMEYCKNGSLMGRLMNGPIPLQESIATVIKIAKAMEVVHQNGIIHYDLKPANLLLDENNNVKVGDFGVANRAKGTIRYLAPEFFIKPGSQKNGLKIDVYALGVTLLELISGQYPFNEFSKEEILNADAQRILIGRQPKWLKEIIVRAIHPDPEQRYADMKSFYQQLEQQNLPNILSKKVIEAGKLAIEIEKLIKRRKWEQAKLHIDHGINNLSNHPQLLFQVGKFFQYKNDLKQAKNYFETVKKKTNLINLDKELGWIHLQEGNYSEATSLLSSYIQTNPGDQEAYNLLLECYFRSCQYETGYELAKVIKENFPKQIAFKLNYALFYLLNSGDKSSRYSYPDIKNEAIFNYNWSVFRERRAPTWSRDGYPSLATKLLFCDFQLVQNEKMNNFLDVVYNDNIFNFKNKTIIKIGRDGYSCNDIQLNGSSISRRHCLIYNSLDNIYIYDLGSFSGTFVNNQRVNGRMLIFGRVQLRVGDVELFIHTDNRKLF